MTLLISFLIAIFILAGIAGWIFSKAKFWQYVDLIYYPLGAIGVALLFASAESQRHLFELAQLDQAHRARLSALRSAVPQTQINTHEGIITSSIDLLATVPSYADACSGARSSDPKCTVAKNLAPLLTQYVQTDKANRATTPELRLAAACKAAEKLLIELRDKSAISSLIGNELLAHYSEGLKKGYGGVEYEPARAYAISFEERAVRAIQRVRPALVPETEATKFVIDVYSSEAHYGTIILQGFLPCLVAPQKQLDLLADWTKSKVSAEEELRRVESEIKSVKESGPMNFRLAFFNLLIWPYLLIAALALKFSKGVAAVRST